MDRNEPAVRTDPATRFLQGFIVGVGAILPGVSGGVMAVMLGLYEGMLNALSGLFRNFRKAFLWLLPVALGGVLGVLVTGNILRGVFVPYETQVTVLFSGFVLGNLPWLFLEAKGETRFRPLFLLCLLGGAALLVLPALLTGAPAPDRGPTFLTVGSALLSGAAMAFGVILPGVSATFLLLYMGTYSAVLSAISTVSPRALFFLGLGFAAASFLMLFTLCRLMKRFRAPVYFAIVGFSLGSLLIMLPKVLPRLTWMCPMLFIFGLCLSLSIGFAKASRLGFTYEYPADAIDMLLRSRRDTDKSDKTEGKDG